MTADAAALSALADRAEKAKGPRLGLDIDIARTLNLTAKNAAHEDGCVRQWVMDTVDGRLLIEAYTASLDAAVGLVPEGLSFGFTAPYRRDVVVSVFVPKSEKSEAQVWVPLEQTVGRAAAATPALALTAASLRARAAMMESGE